MNPRATRAQTGAQQPDVAAVEGDFFVTHPQATRALLRVESFAGTIWEPACGDGTMARELTLGEGVFQVIATDKYDHGWGSPRDFLDRSLDMPLTAPHHIVTNPPFDLAREFVDRALELRPRGKVAMFLRLAWLEGDRRYNRLWSGRPPSRVWVFVNRVPLRRNGGPIWQSGLIAVCLVRLGPSVLFGDAPTLGWLPDKFDRKEPFAAVARPGVGY